MKQSLALLQSLAACKEEIAQTPLPVAMTNDGPGHFCMMELAGMEGPKAQIHLAGMPDPINFAQVRDGVAYLKDPERPIETTALFVVGANVAGGMGAPELAPLATRPGALAFAVTHGREVATLTELPDMAVPGSVEAAALKGDNG